jgi:hypothetical protein
VLDRQPSQLRRTKTLAAADIRLSAVHPLTAFIRLHAVVGQKQ